MSDSNSEPEKKSAGGISISVSEKSTEKIVDVLIDTFRPVQHALGMVGDWTESIRREKQAIRTLKASQRIAEEEHKTIEQPPPKFLIPFLNSASLEDESDEGLKEKWATLLVNAGSKPSGIAYFAKTTLATISSDEVNLLDTLVSNSKALSFETYVDYSRDQVATRDKLIEEIQDISRRSNAGEFKSQAVIYPVIDGVLESVPNLELASLAFSTKNADLDAKDGMVRAVKRQHIEARPIYDMLEGKNIIDIVEAMGPFGENFVTLSSVVLTHLGFDFVKIVYRSPDHKTS